MAKDVLAVLRVPGHPASLRLVRALVREAALGRGAGADWANDLVLAVDEACQNVIRHGYANGTTGGDLVIEVARDGDNDGEGKGEGEGLCVRVTDFAPPVDPAKIRGRDLGDLRPGGLGVHLMRTLTDECTWEAPPPGAGNVLRLRKRLPGDATKGDSVGEPA